MKDINELSKRQLERYPLYLSLLKELDEEGVEFVSSATIAKRMMATEIQVRKDLQSISSKDGKRKVGRRVKDVIKDIEKVLGYNKMIETALIGVGHLGAALMRNKEFEKLGLKIKMGFDTDPSKIGTQIDDKNIYSMDDLEEVLSENHIEIVILTVPSDPCKEIVERLEKINIKGIWNFVPMKLEVNESIIVEDVNLASSLAVLSHRLEKKAKKK